MGDTFQREIQNSSAILSGAGGHHQTQKSALGLMINPNPTKSSSISPIKRPIDNNQIAERLEHMKLLNQAQPGTKDVQQAVAYMN